MAEPLKDTEGQVSLKEFFTGILVQSDRRFEDRYTSLEKLINKNSQEAKEAVKSALDAQEKAVNAALAAAEKAVQKAEIAAEKRFDNFTENYTKNLDRISEELKSMSDYRSADVGKEAGGKNVWGIITAVVAIFVAFASLAIGLIKNN